MTNLKQTDLYQLVTDTIIEILTNSLELSTAPTWINVEGGHAHNPASKRTYSGLNQLLLSHCASKNRFSKNAWLTFNQIQQLEAKITKGSKSTIIVFNDYLYFDEKGNKLKFDVFQNLNSAAKKACKKIYYLKHYRVFNVAQVENLPEEFYTIPEIQNITEFERDNKAEELINATSAVIRYVIGNHAFYSPSTDVITLPQREQFVGSQPFYTTAFHELAHWTGHPTRLNREISNKFGNEKYAQEELVAELASAFLCASIGFSETITNNAAYIQSWLKALKNDKKFIVIASSQASKSADFIYQSATIKTTVAA